MRIVSLLPSTTEIVYALGLGESLVAITHECDYPPATREVPVVTASALDHSSHSSAEIDAAVRASVRGELSIYQLDHAALARLAPDLILTQALCEVCAVSFSAVEAAAATLPHAPRILSFEPEDLAGILGTIVAVANAAGCRERGVALVAELRARIAAVAAKVAHVAKRPRVACLEWIDPCYGPGHWLPEVVEVAGGEPLLGTVGQKSQRHAWEELCAAAPDVLIITPCGFSLEQAHAASSELLPQMAGWADLPAVRNNRVFLFDGNAYFSRPGPRIIEGLEWLAACLHPDQFRLAQPPASAVRRFDWTISR